MPAAVTFALAYPVLGTTVGAIFGKVLLSIAVSSIGTRKPRNPK